MKKLLALLLALTLALSLAACGGSENNGGGQPDDTVNASNQEDQTPQEDQAESPVETPDHEETVPEEDSGPTEDDEPTEDGGETETAGDAEIPTAEAVGASHRDVTFSSAGSTFRLVPTGGTENISQIVYTSADETVATVGEDGTVTAVAPGATTVTMTLTEGGEDFAFDCIIRCNWEEEEIPAGDPAGEDSGETAVQSLSDFYAGLKESYEGLGMMTAYEGELLDNYYSGLSDIAVEEMVIEETAITMANCAVALVRVSASAAAAAVETILAARAKTQADGGAWYPASCETWANAVIVTEGSYVAMFVYPDGGAQDMADAFTAAYGG